MQHKKIDLCITGTDRTASNGDVCNKIGTYLKALQPLIIIFLFMYQHLSPALTLRLKMAFAIYLLKRELVKKFLTLVALMKITI